MDIGLSEPLAVTVAQGFRVSVSGRHSAVAGRMVIVDALPDDWRALVHEYGLNVVGALRGCGVKEACHAKHIITTVMHELSPITGSFSSQGVRNNENSQMVLVPRKPTASMVEASMERVTAADPLMTKREKHRLRLEAAINAAIGDRR